MNNNIKKEDNLLNNPLMNENFNNSNGFLNTIDIENYSKFINYPARIIDEYNDNLRTINPEKIFELMIIIEEINKKVFNYFDFSQIESVIKDINDYESTISLTESKNKKRRRNVNNLIIKNINSDNFLPKKRSHEELEKLCFDLSVMNNNFNNQYYDFKRKMFKFS